MSNVEYDPNVSPSLYEGGTGTFIYVSPSGSDSNSGKVRSSAKRTIAAALAVMGTSPGLIVLDYGSFGDAVWPANAVCGLRGQGPGESVIASLDLSAVGYGLNGVEYGGFTVLGDGISGSGKKGVTLSSTTSVVRAYFHDIAVASTGGVGFDMGIAELCVFDRIAVDQPINAAANDVAYVSANGAFNGNHINRLTLSATVTGSGSVGPSGAVVIKDNGTTTPHDNAISFPQIEGLRCPTNATIFALAANGNILDGIQVFDAGKVSGATGTSYVRFSAPAVLDLGGNVTRGVIPGKGTGATDMDMGVDMRQSRNMVHGTKGYKGTNVILASGVANCDIDLRGAVSAATDPAVVDNSGVITNSIRDSYLGVVKGNAQTFSQGAAAYTVDAPGGAWVGGVRYTDPSTPANGLVGMGTSGVRMRGVAAIGYIIANAWVIQDIALTDAAYMQFGTAGPNWRCGNGSPEGVVAAPVGSLYLRKDGAANTVLYVKESGAGNTGWIAK